MGWFSLNKLLEIPSDDIFTPYAPSEEDLENAVDQLDY